MKKLFVLFLSFIPFYLLSQTLSSVYLAYIKQYAPLAQEQQEEHKIPASITLAQGLLESGAGQSDFVKATNNHFGIKCGSDWTGETFKHDDETAAECFRVYEAVQQSYEDHSAFLKRSRYESLFELELTDYQGWAHGLKRCGYATDPLYPAKLIKLIEDYNLQQYVTIKKKSFTITQKKKKITIPSISKEVSSPAKQKVKEEPIKDTVVVNSEYGLLVGNEHAKSEGAFADVSFGYVDVTYEHEIFHYNGCKYVIATAGDSYASIAYEFGKAEGDLRQFNDAGNRSLQEGDRVYLSWKKKRAKKADANYRVKRADTAWSISQDKAIQMKTLYELNGLPYDVDVRINQMLRLR